MRRIEAILFDVDGTLLDTTEFIYQAYEHTFKYYGIPSPTRRELEATIGKPLEECYQLLSPNADTNQLCETHRTFQAENLSLCIPFPNTRSTLTELKKAGLKIAAVTTRSKRTSVDTLRVANLLNLIDAIISREDVENLKPHPEPLLKALEQLKIKPENSIMVGDTDIDIKAGKNAGTKTIGASYGFQGKKIIDSNPDYVVNNIAEIVPLILTVLRTLTTF